MEDKERFRAKFGSPAMHEKMVDHPDENLRGQVAWHGNESIKRKLANDPGDYVRACAMHGAPKDLLDKGMHDKSAMVRNEVAASGHDEHHHVLIHDGDESVRGQVALHSKNPSILHRMRNDQDWYVKDNVIENPHTSLDTLKDMATNEKHPRIKRAAERMHRGRKDLDGWIPDDDPGTIHHEHVKSFASFKTQVE